jgi:hypothetical protein
VAPLEAWWLTADLARAFGVEAWWALAVRRADRLAEAAGPHGAALRAASADLAAQYQDR